MSSGSSRAAGRHPQTSARGGHFLSADFDRANGGLSVSHMVAPHITYFSMLMIAACSAQSVINRELRERQKLLVDILKPAPEEGIPVSGSMTGRMVALVPGVPLMNGVPGSKLSNRLEDITDKFEESVRVGVRLGSTVEHEDDSCHHACADAHLQLFMTAKA